MRKMAKYLLRMFTRVVPVDAFLLLPNRCRAPLSPFINPENTANVNVSNGDKPA